MNNHMLNPNTHNRLVVGSNPAEPTYFLQSRGVDIIFS